MDFSAWILPWILLGHFNPEKENRFADPLKIMISLQNCS